MTQVQKILAATVGFIAVGMPALADTTVQESSVSSTPAPISTTSATTTTEVGMPSMKETTIKTKSDLGGTKVKAKSVTTEAVPGAVQSTTTKVHTED